MPRKKRSKKLDLGKIDEIASLEPPKSYQSLMYGVLTVIVFFVLIFLGLKVISDRNAGTITEESVQTQSIYVVQKGDNLWKIAEKQYKDGYKWVDIARANNLTDPGKIEVGMKLAIPAINMAIAISDGPSPSATPTVTQAPTRVPTKVITPTPTVVVATKVPTATPTVAKAPVKAAQQVPAGEKISGRTYTVVRGDNLWNIAVRAYGDGYRWVDIARENKLANPDLIHSGNKFTLPR